MRRLASLIVSVVLVAGGIATAVGAAYQRAIEARGVSDPTQQAALPLRLPLPGVNVELTQYDDAQLERELTAMVTAGFVWLRQSFYWSDIEPQQGAFDISAYDRIVSAVSQHPPLKLVAVLERSPQWARRPEGSDRLYAPPTGMSTFGAFAGRFAAHYARQIDHYQIWDEPNLNTRWGGLDPRPADYAAMLKAAYAPIKAADPGATVITAGLAPTTEAGPRNVSDVLYLRALYEAGAQDSFDAVAGKPYGFDSSPLDRSADLYALNFSRIVLLREVMEQYGDSDKALWASHFGWNSLPPDWNGPPSIWGQVDAATQRRYTRESYQRAAHEWPWMGGMIAAFWEPPTPPDDPIQGFRVKEKAAGWFENGQFFNAAALGVGAHHPTDARLTYNGDWEFGPLGADVQYKQGDPQPPEDGSAHTLTFSFEGESLAFRVRRSDYVGFLYARVDGQPANALPRRETGEAYLILRTPDLQPHMDLIVAARGLSPGVHTAEVKFYLGYDQWVLAGIAVGAGRDTRLYDMLLIAGGLLALMGVAGLALWVRSLPRGTASAVSFSALAYVRRMGDILSGLTVSGLALVGMLLTFGEILPTLFRRDPPTLLLTVLTAGIAYFSNQFILTVVALVALWLIIYNRPVVGLALIVFWAPFFLAPMELYLWSFPMVEICLVLTASAVVARTVIERATGRPRSASVPRHPADGVMLAFGMLATLTLLWAEQRAPALRTWRQIVIEPLVFFYLLRRLPLARYELIRLVDTLLLAALIVAVIGLRQLLTGDGIVIAEQGARRLTSVYWSPNNAALFLGRCLPFAVALTLIAPGTLRRVIAGGISAVLLAALVFTQSAGSLLIGTPVALVVVLALWKRRVAAAAVVLIVIGLLALIPLSRFVPRLQGILDLSRSSSFVRTQIWTSTFYLLRDHPITGVGLDQFLYVYRSRYILPDAWREPNLSHPHNVALDYWVSLGISGLLMLAAQQWVFWRAVLAGWRQWRVPDPLVAALLAGAMGSMANFLGHGLVDNSFFVIDLAFVFCFTLAVVTRTESVSTT